MLTLNAATASRRLAADSVSGFTLVEMMAVLVVLGVLAALALPRIAGLSGTLEVHKARDQLIADLRRARSTTQACAETKVTVSADNSGWSVQPSTGCGYSTQHSLEDINVDMDSPITFTYPKGGLDTHADATIILSTEGDSSRICIHGLTGLISRGACP